MPNTITLLLARHGQTQWNLEKRLQGQLDIALTDAGKQQARELATRLKHAHVQALFCSPLSRAHDTAKVCAELNNTPLTVCHTLMERHFGQWQTQLLDEVKSHPNYENVFCQFNDIAPPEGETSAHAAKRFKDGLRQLLLATFDEHAKKASITVAAVAHGEVIRCFLASIDENMRAKTQSAFELFKNTSVTALTFNPATQEFSLC